MTGVQPSSIRQPARACLWASAGLLRYRLCDRDFDCDHCPLDAALRGVPAVDGDAPRRGDGRRTLSFPGDRKYTSGHGWLQSRGERVTAVGLDALAASLLGPPRSVRWLGGAEVARAGDVVVVLDLSFAAFPIAAAATGRLLRANEALESQPGLLADDPYGAGWLYELGTEAAAWPERLVDGRTAHEQALLDLRHFRRRAALGLLSGLGDVGPTMADGGEALTDLRQMLGPQRYLSLVRDLLR